MQVHVLTCVITAKKYSLSDLSRWSFRGLYVLEKAWLVPGLEGELRYSKGSSLNGRKKRWGNVSFWGCLGRILLASRIISRKYQAPAGEKKKPKTSNKQTKNPTSFCHRLGACYNLGIYIVCLKFFFSPLHSLPCSCSVLWNNSALMRRFAWWCSRVRWKVYFVLVSNKGSADYC